MGGSTSHKRRGPRSRKGPVRNGGRKRTDASQGELTQRVLRFDEHAITDGVGFDLMSRLGWSQGSPLGPSSGTSAPSEPIPIIVRSGRQGLGAHATVLHEAASRPDPLLASSPASGAEDGMDVFDPLRPRCRHCEQAVASLKALHKHEKKCRANPGRVVPTPPPPPPLARIGTVEEWLASRALASSEESDFSDDDSVLSAFSSDAEDDDPL